MASAREKKGNWYIEFTYPPKQRQSLPIGKATKKQADEARRRVDLLIGARRSNEPVDLRTAEWLQTASQEMLDKLAAIGLVRSRGAETLGRLVEQYKQSLTVEPQTLYNVTLTGQSLCAFFGTGKLIREITAGDADEFKAHMTSAGSDSGGPLAVATVSKHCGRARQFFGFAVKKRWLIDNPFGHIPRDDESNRERDVYVTTELTQRLIDATPDAEFRLIIALARYAGLRCPSEIRPLRWQWVDWENDVLHVRAVKNRRYAGKGIRPVPLFKEMRPYLDELWQAAPEGADLLFPNHQGTGTAITNKLERICRRIGEPMWPKPWNNLKASCETDLLSQHPALTVVKWIGHSIRVSEKHYAQVSAEDHAKAVGKPANGSAKRAKARKRQ